MITLFTTIKPMKGYAKRLQTNAINSWSELAPDIQILIFTDEPKSKSLIKKNNTTKISDYRSKKGLPYIDDMFNKVEKLSENDIVCYINADIILFNDFLKTINLVKESMHNFFATGQRVDLKVEKLINFGDKKQKIDLLNRAKREGTLHSPMGLDYFIYKKDLFKNSKIPPIFIGRDYWDHWLAYKGKKMSGVLIDATKSITALHQKHDYSHINKQKGKKDKTFRKERKHNKELVGDRMANILDANYKTRKDEILKIPDWKIKLKKRVYYYKNIAKDIVKNER